MNNEDNQPRGLDIFKLMSFVAAFLALIGFTIFLKFLSGKVGLPDSEWIRLMDLFGSVEAIVFAAVGFIFGREVNRQRANSAEKTVKKKEEELKDAKQKEKQEREKAEENEKIALQLKTAINVHSANNRNTVEDISEKLSSFKNDDSMKSFLKASTNTNFLVQFANDLFEDKALSEWITFNWKIEPANKIKSISIGGIIKNTNEGTCTMLKTIDHSFIVEVQTITGHDTWTFSTEKVINENDASMKQKGGSKTSASTRELIEMI